MMKCVFCLQAILLNIVKFTPETLKKCKKVFEYRQNKRIFRKSRVSYKHLALPAEASSNVGYHAYCYKLFTAIKIPSDFEMEMQPQREIERTYVLGMPEEGFKFNVLEGTTTNEQTAETNDELIKAEATDELNKAEATDELNKAEAADESQVANVLEGEDCHDQYDADEPMNNEIISSVTSFPLPDCNIKTLQLIKNTVPISDKFTECVFCLQTTLEKIVKFTPETLKKCKKVFEYRLNKRTYRKSRVSYKRLELPAEALLSNVGYHAHCYKLFTAIKIPNDFEMKMQPHSAAECSEVLGIPVEGFGMNVQEGTTTNEQIAETTDELIKTEITDELNKAETADESEVTNVLKGEDSYDQYDADEPMNNEVLTSVKCFRLPDCNIKTLQLLKNTVPISDKFTECVFCLQTTLEKIVKFTPETLKKCKKVFEYRQNKPTIKKSRVSYKHLELPAEVSSNVGYHAKCYKWFTAIKISSDFIIKMQPQSAAEYPNVLDIPLEGFELNVPEGTTANEQQTTETTDVLIRAETTDESEVDNKLEEDNYHDQYDVDEQLIKSTVTKCDKIMECVFCLRTTFENIIKFTPETLKKCKKVFEYRQNKPTIKKSRVSYKHLELPAEASSNVGYHAQCYKWFTAVKIRNDFEIGMQPQSASEYPNALGIPVEGFEFNVPEGTTTNEQQKAETTDESEVANVLEADDSHDQYDAAEPKNNEVTPSVICFICKKTRKRYHGREVPLAVNRLKTLQLLKRTSTEYNDVEMSENISSLEDYSDMAYHKCCKDKYLRDISKNDNSEFFINRKASDTAYKVLCARLKDRVIKNNERLLFEGIKKEYQELLIEQIRQLSDSTNSSTLLDRLLVNKLMYTFNNKIKIMYDNIDNEQ